MTGIFELKQTIQGKKLTQRAVELPQEILNDLQRWWDNAKHGDTFEVYCELEV